MVLLEVERKFRYGGDVYDDSGYSVFFSNLSLKNAAISLQRSLAFNVLFTIDDFLLEQFFGDLPGFLRVTISLIYSLLVVVSPGLLDFAF